MKLSRVSYKLTDDPCKMPFAPAMHSVRVGIFLILFLGVGHNVTSQKTAAGILCQPKCKDNSKLPVCAYNGKCKFKFNTRCDQNYYNCKYTVLLNRFYELWDAICADPSYTTCSSFYDTTTHTYFPLPPGSIWGK